MDLILIYNEYFSTVALSLCSVLGIQCKGFIFRGGDGAINHHRKSSSVYEWNGESVLRNWLYEMLTPKPCSSNIITSTIASFESCGKEHLQESCQVSICS
jgi:hypothetical protein